MLTWPPHLASWFPLPPKAVLAERPWWRAVGAQFLRSDMPDTALPLNKELLAAHDAEHPLPHPGFRAGQVWALVFTQVTYTGVLQPWMPHPGLLIDPPLMEFSPSWDENRVVWTFAGQPLTDYQFRVLFEDRREAVAYLIADPACPHLAPWAPRA